MNRLEQLAALEGPARFLREPGAWLWGAVAMGFAIRLYLVVDTPGTLDVVVWEGHADEIRAKGLVAYYHGGRYQFNHPPLMGVLFCWARDLALATGIPFAVFLRAPFALLDAGTAWLLLRLMGERPERFAVAVAYWLHPLALIFSAYHGNTDPAIAFFLLGAVLLAGRGRAVAAGAVLGLSLWVKVPGVLALPVLLLAFADWRNRLRFLAAWGAVGIAGYLPVLLQDARAVVDAVFLYPGLSIRTQSGITVWGMQNFLPSLDSVPFGWRSSYRAAVRFGLEHNSILSIGPIVLLAWCRRRERDALGIARNLGRSYVIFYGLTNAWAFQYFAWSLPFWLVSGWRFALATSVAATAYIYPLYAWLCDSWILHGRWAFITKADWPGGLLALRDASTLFFFVAAWVLVVQAVRIEWRAQRVAKA